MQLFQKLMVVVKEELNYFGMTSFSNLDDQEIMALNFNLKSKMIQQFKVMVKESQQKGQIFD